MATVLITQCLQRDFVDPIGPHDPLPNPLHVGYPARRSRALGVESLTREQVGLTEHGWDAETPLWYYVLREADVQQQGDRLGQVGGRIVGEVLVGIIDADSESYRTVDHGQAADAAGGHAGSIRDCRPDPRTGARQRLTPLSANSRGRRP